MTNGESDLTLYGSVSDYNQSAGSVQSGINGIRFTFTDTATGTESNLSAVVTYSNTAITSGNASTVAYGAEPGTGTVSYMAVISKDGLQSSGSIRAKVTDKAGNESTQLLFNIDRDNARPSITLKTPKTRMVKEDDTLSTGSTDAIAELNGTGITISGSATDNSSLASVVVSYCLDADNPSAYFECGNFFGNDAYNWTSDALDISTVSGNTITMLGGEEYDGDPKDLYIKVLATDLAGNTKECIYRYKIAPESDRPKIRFTNISFTDTTDENDTVMSGSAPVWLKSDKLYLNVSDDDGISKFEYKIGNSGYTECNLSGGSFALDITGQGDMQIYFRITDSEGGVFESSNAEVYTAPILQDGSAESVELSNVSVLNLKVDTSSPDVSGFKYSVSETRNGTEDTWSEPSEGFTAGKFGGKSYRYVRFQADATDENGIKEVNFYIGDDSYEGEFVLSGNPINDGIHNGRYVSDPIDLRGLNTTTYDVKVVVQDNAGTSKDRTSVIKVDNTAPVITIEDPGTVVAASSVYGDIDEKDTSVYYIVTITGTADEDLPSMDDPASFASIENPPAYATSKYVSVEDASLTYRIWFDGNTADRDPIDKTAHSELLKDYLITEVNKGGLAIVTQADLDAGRIDPTYNVDIHIIAIDACGNVGHAKRTLAVDPKGDKPTVSISNPRLDWVTDDQGERISKVQTLGGEITILGTATDLHGSKDEVNNVSKAGVSGVGIMIDVVKNDGTRGLDGSWNYADISKLNTMLPECTWIEFDSTEDGGFKEVAFSTIPTDGSGQVYWKYAVKADFTGVAFTLRLNGNKKFDPTGADGDKVREYTVWAVAADKDGNTSYVDIQPGSSLTPNVNFKVDSDRPILDNAKLTGRTDLTMHREYVYGMSVRGAWYYEADIHDDNGISEIKFDGTPVVSGGNIVTGEGALANVTLNSITDGFHIKVAVGKNDNATVCTDSFNISYWENKSENPLDGSTSVSINIDNKPPVSIDSDAEGYNIETNVKNTGRFYTFGSKATEATVNGFNQTGVKRVAFYFTRDISGFSLLFSQ